MSQAYGYRLSPDKILEEDHTINNVVFHPRMLKPEFNHHETSDKPQEWLYMDKRLEDYISF